ncbi:hypothetical protein CR513_07765, partial [Mucuna pruriens]
MARKYDRRVVYKDFQEGDLVLRKTTLGVEKNKLTPKWEGPFRIAEKTSRGAYQLEHLEGRRIPRTWNASSLRSYKTQNGRSKRPIRGPKIEATRPKMDDPRDRSGVRRLKLQDPKRTAQETDLGPKNEERRSNRITTTHNDKDNDKEPTPYFKRRNKANIRHVYLGNEHNESC